MAATGTTLHPPQRIWVIAVHPVVDCLLDLRLRQPAPSGHRCRQLDVDLRAGLRVGDQRGGRCTIVFDQPQRNVPRAEHLSHPGQPLAQRHRQHQLVRRDPQRHTVIGGDLSGHRIPVVQTPLITIGRSSSAQRASKSAIADSRRAHAAFSTRAQAPTASPPEAAVATATNSSNIHSNLLRLADRRRTKPPAQPLLWMKLRLWITQPDARSRRTSGMVRSPALPS